MPAPYSQDLRNRVASAILGGSSARRAADRFGIGISTAIRWAQRLQAEGHVEARAMGGDRRSRLTACCTDAQDCHRQNHAKSMS
jgi:transposase